VDAEPTVLILHRRADEWTPAAAVRLDFAEGHVIGIADYWHCPWILSAATTIVVRDSS
jgi:hypothetical protein